MTTEQRVWAVIYAVNGTTQLGVASNLIAPRTRRRVNAVGDFAFSVPATDPIVAQLAISRYVDIYYSLATVNPRFRGRIDVIAHVVDERDEHLVQVSGSSLACELVEAQTYMGVIADNITAEATSDLLLAGTGWTNAVTGAGFVSLTERFDNMSVWAAHTWLAEQQGGYLRETNPARELELKRGATASGVRLQNASALSLNASPASTVGLVQKIGAVRQEGTQLVNRVVPVGLNAGNVIYDLSQSNRASPYTIQSVAKVRPSIVASVVYPGRAAADAATQFRFNCSGKNMVLVAFTATSSSPSNADPSIWPSIDGKPVELRLEVNDGLYNLQVWSCPVSVGEHVFEFLRATVRGAVAYVVQDAEFVFDVGAAYLRDIDSNMADPGTAPSITLTTEANDLLLDFLFLPASGSDPGATPGTGGVQIYDQVNFNATAWILSSRENGAATSTTISWTIASRRFLQLAVAIKPYVTRYIEDAASVTAHGGPGAIPRTVMMLEQASKMVGASAAQLQAAANTLYDLGAAMVVKRKDPPTFYDGVELVNDIDDSWLPGDSIEVNGVFVVEDPAGTQRAWLNIDATLFVIDVQEVWDRDAVRTWRLGLATQYEWEPTNEHEIAEMRRRLKALEAAA